jgi:hypothetical protein
MPLVPLPSGALAPLETPGLLPLLSTRGDVRGLAAVAFAHDEVDASALTDEDAYAVALWGLLAFCETPAAADLGAVCEAYREPPSWRLGVSAPGLAWELDRGCLAALVQARGNAQEAAAGEDDPERTFSVPDPWSDDE